MNKQFCIKDGYRHNTEATSFDGEQGGEYWTNVRIRRSTEYQYYVYCEAAKYLRKSAERSLLDIGCGPATKVRELLQHHCKRIVLVDQPTVQAIAQREVPSAEFVDLDLESCSAALGTFSVVVCADVLEHLKNPDSCVKMINQSLNDKGIAIISTPERDILRGADCMSSGHPAHVREWNSQEFREYLSSHGLEVITQTCVPDRRLYGIERIRHGLRLTPRSSKYFGCQVAICRRSL